MKRIKRKHNRYVGFGTARAEYEKKHAEILSLTEAGLPSESSESFFICDSGNVCCYHLQFIPATQKFRFPCTWTKPSTDYDRKEFQLFIQEYLDDEGISLELYEIELG